MLLRKAILLAAALLIGASASFAGNANGIGYFALEIPADVTMTIDGNGDDWGWFDQTFAYGPDDMIEIITGEIPSKADIDVVIMTGWTGADRDNRLYGFARVTDDTLHIAQTEADNGWLDDDLEIIPDADNSGGPMKGEGLVHSANGQQFTMHISEPGGYDTGYGNGTWWLRHQAPPEMHWVDALAEANIVVEPAGATNLTPNVVVNYEYAMPLFRRALARGRGRQYPAYPDRWRDDWSHLSVERSRHWGPRCAVVDGSGERRGLGCYLRLRLHPAGHRRIRHDGHVGGEQQLGADQGIV